jgi:hypothetical protein
VRVIDRGTALFHYTRLATGLEFILPTKRIKLSPLTEMRDPRESGKWFNSMSEDADEEGGTERLTSLFHGLHAAKSRYKVLSLTEDSPGPAGDPSDEWTRGYAHPRLWEQYADRHRGICICFDKDALVETLRQQLDTDHSLFRYQSVVYENERVVAHFSMRRIAELGGDEAATADLFDSHADEFLFRKLRDWESEVEYRIVVRANHEDPVYANIETAIRYVMLGEAVHSSYVPAFRELCDSAGIELQRIIWINGQPVAANVPRPGERPYALMYVDVPLGGAPTKG